MKQIIFDLRIKKGKIWNVRNMVLQFPFGELGKPWNTGAEVTSETWIDEFVYEGFSKYGDQFLKELDGRFSIVYLDAVKNRVFLTRDWIGELPFHYLATQNGLYFANTIMCIKDAVGSNYLYDNVRSFPQSNFQIIELKDIDENNIAATFRPDRRTVYFDFERAVLDKVNPELDVDKFDFTQLAPILKEKILQRALYNKEKMNYLLLSGGLDSLCIAVAMKSAGLLFETFTLSVDDKLGEAKYASEFAKRLGVKHYIFDVSTNDIIESYQEAVKAGEAYHLYNVYCTVAMNLIGKRLANEGITNIFCGEAMNEAVGDYKDWKIYDKMKKKEITLQTINTERLQNTKERILYVWGHSVDKGKYNRQLGTGLAKHAAARMIKPFLQYGIELECPYYNRDFLSTIVSLTASQLKEIGEKPQLMWRIMQKDFEKYGFDRDRILKCQKIRMQDGDEKGEYGISSVLISTGNDQEKTLAVFNRLFGSHYDVKEKGRSLLCTH